MKTKFRTFIGETHIDFMSKDKLALKMSLVVLAICLLSLLFRGLNLGLDFTGGTVVEAHYPTPVAMPDVRQALVTAGFHDAQSQYFGTSTDILLRLPPREGLSAGDISQQVLAALKQVPGGEQVQLRRVEFVGPQVGQELVENGGLAMLFALIGIMAYVAFRFEWKLALGTVAATLHDLVFTVGVFSLFQIEFDLTVLAAILAVTGYSVNDTVVVLDRIRENFRKMRRESVREIMNVSINQTLTRTIITAFTVFLSMVVLLLFGGPILRGFSIAMLIGVIVGTYSSIYIASASALHLDIKREDLLPRAKEALDNRP
ncbi:MAG: protein translocase subunit SecF [Candidatus Competibacteraceae bacterium]